MTYYDHATAMAFRLDQRVEERIPRNYELELLPAEKIQSTQPKKHRSVFRRLWCFSGHRNRTITSNNRGSQLAARLQRQ